MDAKFMTTKDLMEMFPGSSKAYWCKLRREGTGPRSIKVGHRVYYRPEDVNAWIESNMREVA
ncbi:helix-turn-helix domain-containing protein [Corynebacterium aurimucosum]|uniref:helix-turn-helix transcriptional regulator n=1 Tax=Corynebacterium sp. LaCa116 TaxID=3391423 RepID=UPI00119EAFFF